MNLPVFIGPSITVKVEIDPDTQRYTCVLYKDGLEFDRGWNGGSHDDLGLSWCTYMAELLSQDE